MFNVSVPPFRQALRKLMARSGIASLEELAQRSQVSTWQLHRIESGLMARLSIENTVKLANTLQISLPELLKTLCPDNLAFMVSDSAEVLPLESSAEIERVKQEYRRLEQELAEQRSHLIAEFQQETLETLETWMLQWPTAAAMARNNPHLSAVKLLALVKPVSDLLKRWGVEMSGIVGESLPYDPHRHQLMEGEAQVGDRVWVRHVGYQQGDKLLYRAKVSPLSPLSEIAAEDGTDRNSEKPERDVPVLQKPLPPNPLVEISSDAQSVETVSGSSPESDGDTIDRQPASVNDPQFPEMVEADLLLTESLEQDTFLGETLAEDPTAESGELFNEDFMDDYPDSRGTRVYFYE
jgi:molecular chaperone GrpE (heat shock protein)